MKTKNAIKTVIAIFIATFVFVNSLVAQHWLTSGNTNTGPAIDRISGNNILGTMGNFPLNIYSGGFQQMVINTGTATSTVLINGVNQNVTGYVGIGR